MNEMTPEARQKLATFFRDTVGEEENRPQIAPATEIDRAIDLSCRACDACGAMAMGAGLGFPVGDSAPLRFHPQPPTGERFVAPDTSEIVSFGVNLERTHTPVVYQ